MTTFHFHELPLFYFLSFSHSFLISLYNWILRGCCRVGFVVSSSSTERTTLSHSLKSSLSQRALCMYNERQRLVHSSVCWWWWVTIRRTSGGLVARIITRWDKDRESYNLGSSWIRKMALWLKIKSWASPKAKVYSQTMLRGREEDGMMKIMMITSPWSRWRACSQRKKPGMAF